jgi:hypothetical protein
MDGEEHVPALSVGRSEGAEVTKTYTRRISAEEAREGYVLVLKDKLAWFPAVGRSFQVVMGPSTKRIAVQSYRCECRGPKEPHEHYYLPLDGLEKGDTLIINKEESKAHTYSLRVLNAHAAVGCCG